MKHFELEKVPFAQAIDRTGRRPVGMTWVDVKKADGSYRSRPLARDINNGIGKVMYSATPTEKLKLLTVKVAAREQAKPDKYMEVPD